MTLDDLPAHETFRAEARDWIRRHAPWDRLAKIRQMRFAGQPFASEHEWLAVARDWQRKKFDAGWACLVWPRGDGGGGPPPPPKGDFLAEGGGGAAGPRP